MKKKILSILLSFCLFPIGNAYAEKDGAYTHSDDFEGYADKASLFEVYTEGSGTGLLDVKDIGGEYGKVCEIGLKSSYDNTMMQLHPETDLAGRIHMKFSVCMKDGLTGHFSIVKEEKPYSLVFFQSGGVYVGAGSSANWAVEPSGTHVANYTEGVWYDIEMVLDLERDYFNFKITDEDGFSRAVNFRQFRQFGLEPWADITNIDYFSFQTWSKIDGGILIDNLYIQEHPVVSTVETDKFGNVFAGEDTKTFNVDIRNTDTVSRNVKVSYVARMDRHGVVYSEEEEIAVDAGATYEKAITVDTNIYDIGWLEVTIDDGLGEPICEEYDFSVINQCEVGENSKIFGINSHEMRDRTGLLADFPNDNEWLRKTAEMKAAAGIGYERGSLEWKSIEKTKGVLALPEGAREYVKALTDNGVKFIMIFAYGNQFYDQGGPPYTEEGRAAFINYAKYVYSELKPYGLDTVEIWNEWDLEGSGFNTTSRPPEDYRTLLIETAKALRELDPDITIIGGASAEADNLTWLGTIFDEGGMQAMDMLAIHPYNHAAAPESNLNIRLQRIIDTMKKYGEPVPIWVTELGWFNVWSEFAITETMVHTDYDIAAWHVRANMFMDAYDTAEAFIQYNFSDLKEDRSGTECHFGIVNTHKYAVVPMSAKPQYVAIANMNKMLANSEFAERFAPDDDSHFMKYKRKDGSHVFAAWSYAKRKQIAFKSDVPVTVYDMYGNNLGMVYPYNGAINLMIGEEPYYLETSLQNLEFTDNTISINNENVTAIYSDRVNYEITVNGFSDTFIVKADSLRGEVTDVTAFANSKASFGVNVTDDREVTDFSVDVKVYDGNNNLYYIGNNYVDILDEQYDVKVLARPYDYSNLNRWQAVIEVQNNAFSRPASGTVSITGPEEFAEYCRSASFENLAGGASKTFKIHFPEMVKKKTKELVTVLSIDGDRDYVYENSVNFAVASYAHQKPTIDGVISQNEWSGTVLTMDGGNYNMLVDNDVYTGDNDLSSNIRLMWDEGYLYFLFDIADEVHSQNFKEVELWRGDSVQFGITDPNSVYVTEFTETGAGLKADGTIDMWRWSSTAKNKDVWEDVEIKIVRNDNNHTIYEMKIPWAGLIMKPEDVTTYYDLGFNIVINDADTEERTGMAELAWGIGYHKNSSQFTRLILEKPTK